MRELLFAGASLSLAAEDRDSHICRNEKTDGYDREFKGIQKVEPISRAHPNLVNILHVGESREADYFFYVMELADDVQAASTPLDGAAVDPATYAPRTLEADLRLYGALPFQNSLQVALSLTDALVYLHGRQLVHRDIKPANIIFVNGVAKLADIGLVADTRTAVTFVGTSGFVPREGPGKPPADIYSLGKVFYEMLTGLDRTFFPQLPEGWVDWPELSARQGFNNIILRACEEDVTERYQTAGELRADLLQLSGVSTEDRTEGESALRGFPWKTSVIVALVVSAGAFAIYKGANSRVRGTSEHGVVASLNAEERASGFKALFNGRDLEGWSAPSSNWVCTGGTLSRINSGGDITYEQERMPANFDLRFEWKITRGGDSGILYRRNRVEYQILDNKGSPYGKSPATWAGSLFDYASQPEDRTRPVGQWNEGRILCEGDRIRHYLNGALVLDSHYNQPEWEEARARLKTKYGTHLNDASEWHLVLRDETGQVWYRNIRQKALK